MRDDAKIMRYKKIREDSRQRFMRTGDKEHLADMFTLDQMIKLEMNKEARLLGKVLAAMTIFTVFSPFFIWWLGSR